MKPSDFKGKNVLIMGLGLHGGGIGATKYFAALGAEVVVTDLKTRRELSSSIRQLRGLKNVTYHLGGHKTKDFTTSDYVIRNPGVRESSQYLRAARRARVLVLSDIEIFFEFSRAPIIGVTGTRGKSTTAYLIWKFLQALAARTYLGGNIRKSVLEFLGRLEPKDLVVLELSSFQLHSLQQAKKSPHIAVVTNIFRDHLNWHSSFQDYANAKTTIFRFQTPRDFLFVNPESAVLKRLTRRARSRIIRPRLDRALVPIVDRNLGAHYRSSVALAVAVARHFKVPHRKIVDILKSFTGLDSRQQLIRVVHGIHFVNDTTATSPDATIAAIRRFRVLAGTHRLIIIAGGQDKNLEFDALIREIERAVDALILLPGTATEKIKVKIKIPTKEARSMAEAVQMSYRAAGRGDYVVLSPGAASFGLFQNEFDRGEKFVRAVKNLR